MAGDSVYLVHLQLSVVIPAGSFHVALCVSTFGEQCGTLSDCVDCLLLLSLTCRGAGLHTFPRNLSRCAHYVPTC